MKSKYAVVILVVNILVIAFALAHALRARSATVKSQREEEAKPSAHVLPPLPAGVNELKFGEFFETPVGARGLEVTEKLRRLDGKRVRILGYMVQQEEPLPGRFMFSPYPVQIHDHDNALADSLPPALVHVSVPTHQDKPVPHTPRLLLLTGTLSVGNRTEPDGRISVVRLAADAPEPVAATNQLNSGTSQTNQQKKGHSHE